MIESVETWDGSNIYQKALVREQRMTKLHTGVDPHSLFSRYRSLFPFPFIDVDSRQLRALLPFNSFFLQYSLYPWNPFEIT